MLIVLTAILQLKTVIIFLSKVRRKEVEQLTVKDFFFCYNRTVMMYLKRKGFKFLLCAYHETSLQKYWMFVRTPELSQALDSYKQINYEMG